jgi:hypothetical protein
MSSNDVGATQHVGALMDAMNSMRQHMDNRLERIEQVRHCGSSSANVTCRLTICPSSHAPHTLLTRSSQLLLGQGARLSLIELSMADGQ